MMSLALAPGNDINADRSGDRRARRTLLRGGRQRRSRQLDGAGGNFRLVFLEADDDALVRRFDATRRRHPLSESDDVTVGIQRERELDAILPRRRRPHHRHARTSRSRELRSKMRGYFEGERRRREGSKTTVISFGYKYGLPLDADIVLDVRFLPNPHWVDELAAVHRAREAVQGLRARSKTRPATSSSERKDLFAVLLPGYQKEGRHYLTIADRVHRRTASLRRSGRGDRRVRQREGLRGEGHPPRRRAFRQRSIEGRRDRWGTRPRRDAPCSRAATPTRSPRS